MWTWVSEDSAEVDRVLTEYAKLAFLDIRKAFDEDGNLKPIHELDDDTAAAIWNGGGRGPNGPPAVGEGVRRRFSPGPMWMLLAASLSRFTRQ